MNRFLCIIAALLSGALADIQGCVVHSDGTHTCSQEVAWDDATNERSMLSLLQKQMKMARGKQEFKGEKSEDEPAPPPAPPPFKEGDNQDINLIESNAMDANQKEAAKLASQQVRLMQRVIHMFSDMLAKTKKDKENEQIKFAAYKQFCDSTNKEKQRNIANATQEIEKLKADIGQGINLQDLTAGCEQKAIDFKQRQQTSQGEIEAMNRAIEFLISDVAKEKFARATSMLLQSSHENAAKQYGKEKVLRALNVEAGKHHSIRLATLASPYEGVIDMLDELKESIQQKALDDMAFWGWCQGQGRMTNDEIGQLKHASESLQQRKTRVEDEMDEVWTDMHQIANDLVRDAHWSRQGQWQSKRYMGNATFMEILEDDQETLARVEFMLTGDTENIPASVIPQLQAFSRALKDTITKRTQKKEEAQQKIEALLEILDVLHAEMVKLEEKKGELMEQIQGNEQTIAGTVDYIQELRSTCGTQDDYDARKSARKAEIDALLHAETILQPSQNDHVADPDNH